MPFVETEEVRYETIDGKRVPVITPKTEVTLTNTLKQVRNICLMQKLWQDVQNPTQILNDILEECKCDCRRDKNRC